MMDAAILVGVVAMGALAAWWSFPTWDDGLLWLNLLEGGVDVVAASQPDRPAIGALWGVLGRRGLLWPVAAVVYAISWLGLGFTTMAMWRTLFPRWAAYSVAAGLLAVSPILVETQTIAVNPVFASHLGPVVAYAVQWWLWRIRPTRRIGPTAIICGLVTVAACLLSEYATLAVMVASGALYLDPGRLRGPHVDRRADRALLAFSLICGAAGYLVYHTLGNAEARPEIRPEHQLASLGVKHLLEVPLRVPFSLWTSVMGAFLSDLGEFNLSRATAWGLPAGGLVGALVVIRVRLARRESAPQLSATTLSWRSGVALCVPLIVGIVAVTAMTTTIRGNVASRLWIPMVPLATCTTLFVLLSVVNRRFRIVVAGSCGVIAAYLQMNAAMAARHADQQTAALGRSLRPELAPSGLTVAMFANFPTNHFVGDPVPRPYDLVSHLTRGWSPEERLRFWAGDFTWQPIHASLPGFDGVCGPLREVDAQSGRGWNRRGQASKVLWISFDADGKVFVERRLQSQ